MPKIEQWSEESERTVRINVSGLGPMRGQGNFEIIPKQVMIVWDKRGDSQSEIVHSINVRGDRLDSPAPGTHAVGLRVWFPVLASHDPASVPGWINELITIFTKTEDLSDQLSASEIAARWLTGFDPGTGDYEAAAPKAE